MLRAVALGVLCLEKTLS